MRTLASTRTYLVSVTSLVQSALLVAKHAKCVWAAVHAKIAVFFSHAPLPKLVYVRAVAPHVFFVQHDLSFAASFSLYIFAETLLSHFFRWVSVFFLHVFSLLFLDAYVRIFVCGGGGKVGRDVFSRGSGAEVERYILSRLAVEDAWIHGRVYARKVYVIKKVKL